MSATLSETTLEPFRRDGPTAVSRGAGVEGTVGFDVEDQRAGTINNVGGDQYNEHRYELVIEPMRRRARVLLRLGNVLILSALGAQLAVLLAFGTRVKDFVDSVGPAIDHRSPAYLKGPGFEVLLAIPLAAVIGFIGLVLVVVSVSMRRRAEREAKAL